MSNGLYLGLHIRNAVNGSCNLMKVFDHISSHESLWNASQCARISRILGPELAHNSKYVNKDRNLQPIPRPSLNLDFFCTNKNRNVFSLSVCLSVCLSVSRSVSLSVSLPVSVCPLSVSHSLSVRLSAGLPACLPVRLPLLFWNTSRPMVVVRLAVLIIFLAVQANVLFRAWVLEEWGWTWQQTHHRHVV